MTDGELVERLRVGDGEAFDAIFRAWYPRLVRLAEVTTRDRAVAEELAQDVLLELWKRRAALDVSTALAGYLYQATRNRAYNHQRHLGVQRRGALQLVREEAREASAPSEVVAAEMRVAAEAALAELPPRCRRMFEMSRVQGRTYPEIAEALGVSVKAVEAQLGRALRIFRAHLAPWLPEGERL